MLLERRLAKGRRPEENRGAFDRTETLVRIGEDFSFPTRRGPRPPHAASVEALLSGSRAFLSISAPPGSDEPSGRNGSLHRAARAEALDRQVTRSARYGFYDRDQLAG